VNLHSAHMDPDDWQLPQQFRPERFLDELSNGTDRDRVIPFALGEILTASDFLHIIRCMVYVTDCLQCFDAVGWAAGRASGL